MRKEALFSDETENFVTPAEPGAFETVTLRFRTEKGDAQSVHVVSGSKHYVMRRACARDGFDYYELRLKLEDKPFRYCFEIHSCDDACYYDRRGAVDHPAEEYAFAVIPGYAAPGWAKGAVMYQIFVDRFCNGDPGNDVEDGEYIYVGKPCVRAANWDQPPEHMGVRDFYGGDLQGVLDKLDYLQDLGVEAVYFNPLFVSPSNHKYDVQDYDYIDPHYGVIANDGGDRVPEGETDNRFAEKYRKRVTDRENLEAGNRLFIRLVEEMHRRGMKVILDGVFNHCGSFNKWLDRERIYEGTDGYEPGAYISKDSPYRTFFRFRETQQQRWPCNDSYEGWWGHETLPKLNYEESEKLEADILRVAEKWLLPPYRIDGWRLDVAADLGHSIGYNHTFWKKFRAVVKRANPEALILAEHYGNPRDWLSGGEWDTVMNYDAFMEPVSWYLTGMEKHSDAYRSDLLGNAAYFARAMRHHMAHMPAGALLTSMNELSNHDHSRFLTRTNHVAGRVETLGYEAANQHVDEAVMREAVVMQMTWIGAPTVYYGDEAGMTGFTDPDNRRAYPWGRENRELLAFHRDAIRIHKNSKALRRGSLEILDAQEQVLMYGRFTRTEKVVVVVNPANEAAPADVPVWQIGIRGQAAMTRLLYSYKGGYSTEKKDYPVTGGMLSLVMAPCSAIILQEKPGCADAT